MVFVEANMNKVSAAQIGQYFSGKAGEQVKWAVGIINRSLVEDSWVKGASRTVHAALTKFSTATKKNGRWVDGVAEGRPYEHGTEDARVKPLRNALWTIGHHMYFGGPVDRVEQAVKVLDEANAEGVLTDEEKTVLALAREFAAAWAPIWSAVKFLDALRPKPVFVLKTLSPTGARLLLDAGYKPDSCRLPEFRYYRDEDGMPQMEIIWPAGTRHNRSRFAGESRRGNLQCHACGHAIKNAFNWVPLAIDTEHGEIHSFWVGRDCAKKLFGVDMKGDASYKNVEGR